MAGFRPLQPAPTEEQPPPPQPRPALATKPKRTVTLGACVACRKRKSKCDGHRPICSCCAQKDTQCVYELGPNEKPSQAMKRKNEEMQGELSNLRTLYDVLRFHPEQEALAILRRIRAESPGTSPAQHVQQLTEFLRSAPPTNPPPSRRQQEVANPLTLPPLRHALDPPFSNSPGLPSLSIFPLGFDEPSSQRRRHASDADVSARSEVAHSVPPPTSIEALLQPVSDGTADLRLEAVRNWTSVSQDGQLMVVLMTLWHKWEYSYYHYLDWDIFLDDLASGRDDFCSELLVNALLASASFHSSLVKNRNKPFGDSHITRFYREARRLWEADEGTDSLTRVQAALALFMVFGKHGRDKVGYMFLQEACRIARNLDLFRLPSSATVKSPNVEEERWNKARAVTAWALFNFQLTMSFTYSLPPQVNSQPPVAIPYDDTESEALFRTECARSVVLLDCLNTLINPDDPSSDIPPSPEQIEILYLRLKLWFDHRTPSLDPVKHPSPENLLAAMQYHVSIIRLFQPFMTSDSTHTRPQSYRTTALSRTASATRSLRTLIFTQDALHGWATTITIVLHPLVVAVFASLEDLANNATPPTYTKTNSAYAALLTCLYAIRTISTYNFYAQPLFRLLMQSCATMAVPLPEELVQVDETFHSEEWTRNAASMVSSQYIADVRKAASGVRSARMDCIVSQWGRMTLGEKEKGRGFKEEEC